ncbi:MAG: hypothetical protein KBS42_05150 [Bacteroidales bacterium]|nr:hypothetical protein [Candidatus Colicola coprequi]
MRTEKEIQKDIILAKRAFVNAKGDECAELRKKLVELREEAEKSKEYHLCAWLNQLAGLHLEGEKHRVIEIYKMCVRNCIKARAVFGSIEEGNFVYFDPKLEKEMSVAVPDEFDRSMLEDLDLDKYEKIKRYIVPDEYMFESIVGKMADEYGIKI